MAELFQHDSRAIGKHVCDIFNEEELAKGSVSAKSARDFHLALSSKYGNMLGNVKDTLVFLDDVQFYPHLLTLLKDLKKNGRFRCIASGSLLGITLKHVFIPMGSIDEVKMFPLDFEEFLWANGVGDDVVAYLRDCFENIKEVNGTIHEQIFRYYKDDCSRYDLQYKLMISRIYDGLISNMQNKVNRVQFKKVEGLSNANVERYADEFDYLVSSGISISVRAVSNPVFPLSQSSSKDLLKLYYDDVGLLTNLLFKNNIGAILNNDKGLNLGSVYETAVATELAAHGHDAYYFDSKKTGEVDFLINDYNRLCVLPIEVKSGNDQNNFRAIPKLVDDASRYRMPIGYVFGNKNVLLRQGNLITLPIYMIMFV